MPKRIWKYTLSLDRDYHEVDAPRDAEFVAVGMQHGEPTVWALLDPGQPSIGRTLSIHGTGHGVPDGEHYIGTIFDSLFVWHIFEVHHEND